MAKQWQGMNWIRGTKRAAIYARDGQVCVYCLATLAEALRFTLDHLRPRSKGGTNEACNLVTACLSCNSARADQTWRKFAADSVVIGRIQRQRRRKLKTVRPCAVRQCRERNKGQQSLRRAPARA